MHSMCISAASLADSELLHSYLLHRRRLGQKRGPLFLSESRRNYSEPISIWSWSKVILKVARRAASSDSARARSVISA